MQMTSSANRENTNCADHAAATMLINPCKGDSARDDAAQLVASMWGALLISHTVLHDAK